MDTPETELGHDQKILLELNDDYIHWTSTAALPATRNSSAEDFTASLPDLVFRNRKEFLDLITQPRPFTGLTLLNVTVRVLGDVALLHGRVRYTTKHNGRQREAGVCRHLPEARPTVDVRRWRGRGPGQVAEATLTSSV